MQNSLVMFTFSAFDWNYPFWAYLVQKFKIFSLSWNLIARLIRIYRNQWCSLSPFSIRNTLFEQTWSKNQNCKFKLKFGTPRLVRICRIQCWSSFFLFLTGDTRFRQSDGLLVCFRLEVSLLGKIVWENYSQFGSKI